MRDKLGREVKEGDLVAMAIRTGAKYLKLARVHVVGKHLAVHDLITGHRSVHPPWEFIVIDEFTAEAMEIMEDADGS